MWKVHSVMCEYVAKWRAFFIYWSVWSNKLETLHIRLQLAYLLNALPFFPTVYPPFPQKQMYSREATFLRASFICWHQWVCTTDECGCLCLILVIMAAVRLDRELKNPIICHCVFLPNSVFCQSSYAGRGTLWCAQQVSAFCPNPAQRYKTISCTFLIVGPIISERKGKKLSRQNTLTRRKAASKHNFRFVCGRKFRDVIIMMDEGLMQDTGWI